MVINYDGVNIMLALFRILPVFKHIANVAPNNDVYWKNCKSNACKKYCNFAGRPTEIVCSDDTGFGE